MTKFIFLILAAIFFSNQNICSAAICPKEFMEKLPEKLQALYGAIEAGEHDLSFQDSLNHMPLVSPYKSLFGGFYSCNFEIVNSYEQSLKKPMSISWTIENGKITGTSDFLHQPISLFKETFFINRYFVDYLMSSHGVYAQGSETDKAFTELSNNQPWIRWDQQINHLEIQSQNVKPEILGLSSNSSFLYRGASLIEFNFLRALKLFTFETPTLLQQKEIASTFKKLSETWTLSAVRKKYFDLVISELSQPTLVPLKRRQWLASKLIMVVSEVGGRPAISMTFNEGNAAYWAFFMGSAAKDPSVVMEFKVNFQSMPSIILDGIYLGVESSYVEAAVRSSEARLELLKGLNTKPITKEKAEDDYGPNLIKLWQ